MRKQLFVALLLVHPFFVFSQQCNCEKKFQFVKHEMETNYAGFKDKTKDRAAYEQFTREYASKIQKTNDDMHCLAFIDEWLRYFKDHHVQMRADDKIPYDDTVHIDERIKQSEVIPIPQEKLDRLPNDDTSVEGIYFNNGDTMYTIAVIKSKNEYRDYVGVVLTSKSKYWHPGEVKFEIKRRDDGMFTAIQYNRYHVPGLRLFNFYGMCFDGCSWMKYGKHVSDAGIDFGYEYHKVYFKKLSDSTLYLQIGTFNLSNARAIDSVIKANEQLLRSTPYLIIDVRGNGGGADYSYLPIAPWLYTGPVAGIGNDIYATKDNAARIRKYTEDPDFPAEQKQGIIDLADEMSKNTGEFIPHASNDTAVPEKVEPYPKKVVVLIDDWCASSTEEFLLEAKQSKKVTLMGKHTIGELDYSNVLTTEGCGVKLYYSSTRSKRIDMGLGIDNIGIQPNIVLTKGKDWIEEARKYLER